MNALRIEQRTPAQLLGSLDRNEQQNAPSMLYLFGDELLLGKGIRVSVSGSRRPTLNGIRRSRALSRQLVERGIVVVSGLSAGIDAVVHDTTMDCGGRTIAVLGTALNQIFPLENALLHRRIAREHLLVSQFRSGTPIHRRNIPMRNRTMALMSHATIIVEAAQYSGTLHLAWETLRLGRLLFLLQNIVSNPALSWPREMIKRGARVMSRETMDDCLKEIAERARPPGPQTSTNNE